MNHINETKKHLQYIFTVLIIIHDNETYKKSSKKCINCNHKRDSKNETHKSESQHETQQNDSQTKTLKNE